MRLFWLVPLSLVASLSAADVSLLAGAGVRTITPQQSVFLAGLKSNRRSTGVHDELYARALAWSDGTTTVLVVGLDLIGLLRPDVLEVQERLAERGVPTEHLLIAATHVHSGPDTIGIWGPEPTVSGVDPEYMAFLKDQIVAAAEEAYRSLKPARLSVGTAEIPDGVAYNARVPGLYDRTVRVLRFEEPQGAPIGTLVQFTAHPETLWSDSTLLTADYVAIVYRRLDAQAGGITVFVNGALGGMVTVDSQGRHTFEEAERIGSAVAEIALEALRQAQPIEDPAIGAASRTFRTPLENENFRALARLGVLPGGLTEEQLTTETHLIQIGNEVAIVTIPGELLPRLGFVIQERVRESLQTPTVFLFGLTNDELGYILPEDEFGTERYRYESSMSVGRAIGSDLLRAVEEMLKEIQKTD